MNYKAYKIITLVFDLNILSCLYLLVISIKYGTRKCLKMHYLVSEQF